MTHVKRIYPAILAIAAGLLPVAPHAQAASQDECAIWLCLPGGFPSGCSAAYSAFKKRIKKLKPPLPPLSECIVSAPSGAVTKMSFREGSAMYIPGKTECTPSGNWRTGFTKTCTTTPASYVDNRTCFYTGESTSGAMGCTSTVSYIKVYDDAGAQVGDTYYWSMFGLMLKP